ncbi:hypothetical protein AVEN_275672-1 [Araneus ventricosus]|uniref:Tc1-like transposase DDE domain-containing protein n=1 Tax=Araneus ventricosus TaxID=182803 RepID=A0A4Y2MI43_ARAVE|nr:hypothetical protein AVEN_275672-1 [Araneus ventricosus]
MERPNRPLRVRWGSVTAVRYRDEIPHPLVRPFIAAMGTDALFMDENARPHRARLVRSYLESETIPQMAWPARNFVADLSCQVCHDKLISRKTKLAASVHAIWVVTNDLVNANAIEREYVTNEHTVTEWLSCDTEANQLYTDEEIMSLVRNKPHDDSDLEETDEPENVLVSHSEAGNALEIVLRYIEQSENATSTDIMFMRRWHNIASTSRITSLNFLTPKDR